MGEAEGKVILMPDMQREAEWLLDHPDLSPATKAAIRRDLFMEPAEPEQMELLTPTPPREDR